MWLYSSIAAITAGSAATLLLLVWAATGENPLVQAAKAVRWILWDPRALSGLLLVIAVLVLNKVETQFETRFQVPWDYTDEVAGVGTGLILFLQRLEWAPVTHLLTFAYVILFQTVGIASAVVYAAGRDWDSLRRLFTGFIVNYLAALPFYLFVPVKEAWAGAMGVRFLIPQLYPAFEAQYRSLSGLDNCFPSLHTSLALTFALVALQSGHHRLALLAWGSAALIILSTLYLGVHWVPDMFTGAALAVLASGYVFRPVFRPAASLYALPGRGER